MSTTGKRSFGTVILGAGASSRMGRAKLLLPWGDHTVAAHLVGEWMTLGALQVAVVWAESNSALGAELERLEGAWGDRLWRISNPLPDRGMFSSIQCAARWDGWNPAVERVVVALGDQPHLRRATLAGLLAWSDAHPGTICQPVQRSRAGHPVVLPRTVFDAIGPSAKLNLREFLAADHVPSCRWACDDPGLTLDMDRPEDYVRAGQLAGITAK